MDALEQGRSKPSRPAVVSPKSTGIALGASDKAQPDRILSDVTNITSGTLPHFHRVHASPGVPLSTGAMHQPVTSAVMEAVTSSTYPTSAGSISRGKDMFRATVTPRKAPGLALSSTADIGPASMERFQKRRQELLEFHRQQLADYVVQQRSVQHQQLLCEQLTDLIAEQESVLHTHTVKSLRMPHSNSQQTGASSPPSSFSWHEDASIDRDAIPLHSTSLYIPVPSDSLEDPDTMGHLVPQLFDDCLDLLLDDPSTLPNVSRTGRPVAETEFMEESVVHSAVRSLQSYGAHDSDYLGQQLVSSKTSPESPSESAKSSASRPSFAASVSDTPDTTNLLAEAARSLSAQESTIPLSLTALQSTKEATAGVQTSAAATNVREDELLKVVSQLGRELDQCKQQLHNSLQVQRIQAGALQTLWQEMQELRQSQEDGTAKRSVMNGSDQSNVSEVGSQTDQLTTLTELCEQLQHQVDTLQDQVCGLSGSVYVAGETKERLQRLGFGVADAEQSADEQEQLSDLALVHDSDASSLKSTSLSVLGSDDDLSFASHSVSECESAEERQSSQCDGRDVAQSELEGKAHHRDSDHLFSFDAEPSSHTASDSGSPCSSRHAGRGFVVSASSWSNHEVLLSWQQRVSSRVGDDDITKHGSEYDDITKHGSEYDDGLLGYRVTINDVPVIPMIPAPSQQVLVTGLSDGTKYKLAVLKVHVEGEGDLAPAVYFQTDSASPGSSQPALCTPARCSSTSLSPRTPVLRINYKSLKDGEQSQAVLATLHHRDLDDSASSLALYNSRQLSPVLNGVMHSHSITGPWRGDEVGGGAAADGDKNKNPAMASTSDELEVDNEYPSHVSSSSNSKALGSLRTEPVQENRQLCEKQNNANVEAFTAKLLAVGIGNETS